MASVKEKIIKEVEKIPEEKLPSFTMSFTSSEQVVESKKKAVKDRRSEAVKFSVYGKVCPLKRVQCLMRYRQGARELTEGFCEEISIRYQYRLLLPQGF